MGSQMTCFFCSVLIQVQLYRKLFRCCASPWQFQFYVYISKLLLCNQSSLENITPKVEKAMKLQLLSLPNLSLEYSHYCKFLHLSKLVW